MKVSFVISTLQNGGAERALVNMANYWSKKGRSVEIVTLWAKENVPFYKLESAIVHSPLSVAGNSGNVAQFVVKNLGRIRVMRDAITQSAPNVVVSFLDRTNVMTALATVGLEIPIVLCERSNPWQCKIGGRGWELLRTLTYRRANAVVVQTRAAVSFFGPRIQKNTWIIPNGVEFPGEVTRVSVSGKKSYKMVSLGRLSKEKGMDLLLTAFSKVHSQFPTWTLTIWGEGPQRAELEQLVEKLGLKDCVSLPGRTQNPVGEMRGSDLFVLASRYEGFPNALLEAMSCNLPVISFDCPNGPQDVIRHEVDGLLVPPQDVNALAEAMRRLMANDQLRNQLGAKAGEVIENFGMEKVMGQWDELLEKIVPTATVNS